MNSYAVIKSKHKFGYALISYKVIDTNLEKIEITFGSCPKKIYCFGNDLPFEVVGFLLSSEDSRTLTWINYNDNQTIILLDTLKRIKGFRKFFGNKITDLETTIALDN